VRHDRLACPLRWNYLHGSRPSWSSNWACASASSKALSKPGTDLNPGRTCAPDDVSNRDVGDVVVCWLRAYTKCRGEPAVGSVVSATITAFPCEANPRKNGPCDCSSLPDRANEQAARPKHGFHCPDQQHAPTARTRSQTATCYLHRTKQFDAETSRSSARHWHSCSGCTQLLSADGAPRRRG